MTPSPWGRSPPPPLSGMYRYSEYRWSLAASHPRLAANAAGAEPPHCRASSKGCVLPSAPSAPMCRQSSAPRPPPPPPSPKYYTGPLPSSPPGTPCCSRWGAEERHTCAGLRAEVPRALHNAAEAGRGRRGSGIAAAAAPRSPYLMLMSLSGGDLLARGFYSAR